MPLPTVDLVKVNLVGHLPGSEVFNWGFWLAPSVDQTQSQLNTMATDIAALITSTTFSYAKSMVDSSSGYDKVRLYSYPSGFQTAQKVAEADITGVTGTGTSYHPLQAALVVTTQTGTPGGRNRGRYYLPASAVSLGSDHQIASATLLNVTLEQQTFLNAVNQVTNVLSACVVSRVGIGSNRYITQIVADSRLDVQRRRANKETVTAKSVRAITL